MTSTEPEVAKRNLERAKAYYARIDRFIKIFFWIGMFIVAAVTYAAHHHKISWYVYEGSHGPCVQYYDTPVVFSNESGCR